MVNRRYRLREHHDINRVRSRGRSVAHGAIVLRYMPNNLEPQQNRYTVIAGRKCGNAVQRNRLKRVVREALRSWHPLLEPGHDLAIICRGGVDEMPDYAAAQAALTHILTRTDLIKPDAQHPDAEGPVGTSWREFEPESTPS